MSNAKSFLHFCQMLVIRVESVVWSDGCWYFIAWDQFNSQPFYDWVFVFFPAGCYFFLYGESVDHHKKISVFFVVLWSASHVCKIHFDVLKRDIRCWKHPLWILVQLLRVFLIADVHSNHIVFHHISHMWVPLTDLPCSSKSVFCSYLKDHVIVLTIVDKICWGTDLPSCALQNPLFCVAPFS